MKNAKSITLRDFQAYKEIQSSGDFNMFDIRQYDWLIGLDKEQILYIMKHYQELEEKEKQAIKEQKEELVFNIQ